MASILATSATPPPPPKFCRLWLPCIRFTILSHTSHIRHIIRHTYVTLYVTHTSHIRHIIRHTYVIHTSHIRHTHVTHTSHYTSHTRHTHVTHTSHYTSHNVKYTWHLNTYVTISPTLQQWLRKISRDTTCWTLTFNWSQQDIFRMITWYSCNVQISSFHVQCTCIQRGKIV